MFAFAWRPGKLIGYAPCTRARGATQIAILDAAQDKTNLSQAWKEYSKRVHIIHWGHVTKLVKFLAARNERDRVLSLVERESEARERLNLNVPALNKLLVRRSKPLFQFYTTLLQMPLCGWVCARQCRPAAGQQLVNCSDLGSPRPFDTNLDLSLSTMLYEIGFFEAMHVAMKP